MILRLPTALTAALTTIAWAIPALALSFVVGEVALAEVRVTPKHLLIIRPGVDAVWGSYVFAVQNDGEEEAVFKGRVMLPKETVDFMPQEGVEPSQVALARDGGGIEIEAPFPHGVHIVSIGFKTDARFGGGVLTLVPEQEVGSLTVLTPRGGDIRLEADGLAASDQEAVPDPQYKGYLTQRALPAGQTYTIRVNGLPEGRTRLWIAGGAVAAALIVLAGLLAWRTKPQIKEGEEGGGALLVV